MEARLKEGDTAEASGADDSFTVRCQGVERAWEVAGVTRETSAHELKALLAAASGIDANSQRLIFQGMHHAAARQRITLAPGAQR